MHPMKDSFNAGELQFVCNVCGHSNRLPAVSIERESGACAQCGSVVRFRSLMAVLTQRLFEQPCVLKHLAANASITGLGMSDAGSYASVLAEKFSYTNTYYHCEPLLDIVNPHAHWIGANDFVISSDVFEHVAPPVQRAFDNLLTLLKPGGVVVFSVPFSLEAQTREHYPDLHDFNVVQEANGDWVLTNTTRDGIQQIFRDLVFHGGPGSTLEMRLFCLDALRHHFAQAGFVDFQIHSAPMFEHGIFSLHPWGLTLSAKRPA
jgi:SAM-dependent methyltransferase